MKPSKPKPRLSAARLRYRAPHGGGVACRRGFAIITALMIMVLVTALAVGLLGLASITLRTTNQSEAQAAARANARLGMMIALGKLQAEMGPDGRINCQSGIDGAALPGQRHWLAIYDAWDASQPDRPAPDQQFRRYLVSGNDDALRSLNAARSPLAGETIEMVSAGSIGHAAAADRVNAGLVPVTGQGSQPGGAFAWWIGDENSKAKINAGRDFPGGLDPAIAALHHPNGAPGTGFRTFTEFQGLPVAGGQPWNMGDELRAKSLSMASLDLLPGVARPSDRYFHDITTTSHGLLTDVRNARLKRDLSLYLERPHTPALQHALYTVGSSPAVNFNPDTRTAPQLDEFSGITMEELWIYYNLYKEVDHQRPRSNDDRVGHRRAGFPTLLAASSREAFVADKFYPYKRHVFSQVRYMLSLAAVPSESDPRLFDLRIAADPIVVLWNPNNVAVEYQVGNFATVGFSGLPYDAVFTAGRQTVSVPFTSFFDHRNVNLIRGELGLDHAIILQPGESRVFSRESDTGDALASGWRYTTGRLLDHPDFPKSLQGDTNVRLTLRPAVSGGYLNYVTYWFGPRLPATTSVPALQSGSIVLRGDTSHGDLPTISTPQTLTARNIADERKVPHMLLSYHMRTETDNRTPSKSWIWSNPSISFRIAPDTSTAVRLLHQMEVQITPVSTWENPHVQITPGNQAYWGGGVRADFGVPFFTLRSVPMVPMQSIAAFQHSCANGFRRYWKDSDQAVPAPGLGRFPSNALGLDGHRYLAPMGSKLIGNSFAHPLIPSHRTDAEVMATSEQVANPVASPMPVADHAYLANAALWDSWFFSSLAPQTVHPYRGNTRILQQIFDDFFTIVPGRTPVPLPTSRMIPYQPSDDRPLIINNNPVSDAHRRLAAHMMVDGAFNVNSTSVHAWRALLASLRDHAIATLDPDTTGGITLRDSETDTTPVIGLFNPNGNLSTPTGATTEAEQWRGFRTLSDAQIDALAEELVRQIRIRGPFLSLADFVNRRVGTDAELARHGALQAAIDAAGLNGALDQGNRALGSIGGVPFPEAGQGSRATGIPGYITQADLLTPLGPFIQPRSDTFTIRAYGNSTDAAGNIIASAWCEVIVQRVPDYIDPDDSPDVPAASLSSTANRDFGRKFHIISFRWLNASEV